MKGKSPKRERKYTKDYGVILDSYSVKSGIQSNVSKYELQPINYFSQNKNSQSRNIDNPYAPVN
jgi:hypothetical protein